MAGLKWFAIILSIGLFIWAATLAYGQWRWQGRTAALLTNLAATRVPISPRHYDPDMLRGLPPPVQRYLAAVLTQGQPMVTGVTLAHVGTFNMGEETDRWKPFTSLQHVSVTRHGFVWNGTVQMLPGLPVRVHDAYIAGEGLLMPAIFGLFPLTELRGAGDIAEGELVRFLAETPWYPTMLLPGQGVVWTAIDNHNALATLRDGDVSARLVFRFGTDDLVASVRADARGRTVGSRIVPTPWEGRWTDFQRVGDMIVPMTGEVAWQLPAGSKPYWRGRVVSLTLD